MAFPGTLPKSKAAYILSMTLTTCATLPLDESSSSNETSTNRAESSSTYVSEANNARYSNLYWSNVKFTTSSIVVGCK